MNRTQASAASGERARSSRGNADKNCPSAVARDLAVEPDCWAASHQPGAAWPEGYPHFANLSFK